MKKIALLFLTFFLANTLVAQNMEYSLHLNSGLFSFGGESATLSSFIIMSDVATVENYTNNPYGKESAFSYGLAGQVQRITKNQWILGVQSGYEVLRSQVRINAVAGEFTETPEVSSGNTILSKGFINLYPHFGKRVRIGDIKADLAVGPEFGFNTYSSEKGEANLDNNTRIKTDINRNDTGTDFRIRPSLTIHYNKLGVSVGYSHGFHNYRGNLTGANRESFARFIRFGITYQIQ